MREQHAQTVRNPNTVLQLAAAAAISQPPAGRDMREFPTRVNSDNYEKWAVYSWNPSIPVDTRRKFLVHSHNHQEHHPQRYQGWTGLRNLVQALTAPLGACGGMWQYLGNRIKTQGNYKQKIAADRRGRQCIHEERHMYALKFFIFHHSAPIMPDHR